MRLGSHRTGPSLVQEEDRQIKQHVRSLSLSYGALAVIAIAVTVVAIVAIAIIVITVVKTRIGRQHQHLSGNASAVQWYPKCESQKKFGLCGPF